MGASACGERSQQSDPASSAASHPLVIAPTDLPRSRFITTSAGGISARYAAQYEGEALTEIFEEREAASTGTATATYLFQGARLMRYEGPPLEGEGSLVLEFDLQGKVLVARDGAHPASEEAVSAIRARAQLLRNHALASRATQTHAMQ